MDQEMAFHVESLTREYVRSGVSRADAEAAARRRFGSVLHLKERGHDVRTARVFEDIVRDVRHMGRGLRRSPGFSIAVILTLALGIGGNTAIFSVVDQLLLRPLPYPHGEQLLTIYESFPLLAGAPRGGGSNAVSPANWLDWQRDSQTLQELAAWRTVTYTLTGVGDATRLTAQTVSSEFFPLLGSEPLLGRTISAADDLPNAPRVAVLSHHLWQQRFGGDPSVIGRVVHFNDRPVIIIGVMPARFQFMYPDNDVWTAYRLDRNQPWRETAGRFLNVVARRRAETTTTAARAEVTEIARRLAATYQFNKNTSVW